MERVELAFHERVSRAFETFARAEWQRDHPECGPVVSVDGTGSEAEVFERVMGALRARWPESFSVRPQPAVPSHRSG